MWFEELMEFKETKEDVYKNIVLDDKKMKSLINGKEYTYGHLEVLPLSELRYRVSKVTTLNGNIKIKQEVADVKDLHLDEKNSGTLFQVASQFNLLEMASPSVTPEQGVSIYEYDHTQGPICAISTGAGTIYRNYFANVNGARGQSKYNQIDCLKNIGIALGNDNNRLWEMQNGYALLTKDGLEEINQDLKKAEKEDKNILMELLEIGIQWHTQVTKKSKTHLVSQAYCSALPIAYVGYEPELWEEFAKLILYASYEATICAGILNAIKTKNNRIYLTLVGGGVFGNKIEWMFKKSDFKFKFVF